MWTLHNILKSNFKIYISIFNVKNIEIMNPKYSSRICETFTGIGRDLTLRLSKFKGAVIALSKTQKYLDTLKEEDPKIEILCVNLRDWDETKKMVESVLPIDLLINNAGVACLRPFLEATPEDFNLTFDVNVKAVMNVSQVIAKDLIKRKVGGSIVNLSSQASEAALKDHAVYCASKGALQMLTR